MKNNVVFYILDLRKRYENLDSFGFHFYLLLDSNTQRYNLNTAKDQKKYLISSYQRKKALPNLYNEYMNLGPNSSRKSQKQSTG